MGKVLSSNSGSRRFPAWGDKYEFVHLDSNHTYPPINSNPGAAKESPFATHPPEPVHQILPFDSEPLFVAAALYSMPEEVRARR